MSNQPIDKGRIMAAVDYYQAKENGNLLFNPDNSPKMKPKWWPIGECTKWVGDNGEYITRTIYCEPRVFGRYEQREYWDSENPAQQPQTQQQYGQQPQGQQPQQSQPQQQNPQQQGQQQYGKQRQ
tara:strand:+ start:44384 stop:44758 length:375 start_codon:yes stop_codon:yes gene_type:complete